MSFVDKMYAHFKNFVSKTNFLTPCVVQKFIYRAKYRGCEKEFTDPIENIGCIFQETNFVWKSRYMTVSP